MNWSFEVCSGSNAKFAYTTDICSSPSCTFLDFKKNGLEVYCKHILFVLLYPLDRNEIECSFTRSIGGADLRSILEKTIDARYFNQAKKSHRKDYKTILADYPSYNNVQLFTIHHKLLKYTKCQGCKDLLLISELSIKVDGALRIPLGTKKAAELTMYF